MEYIPFWKIKMEISGWGQKISASSNLKRQERITTPFNTLNTIQMTRTV